MKKYLLLILSILFLVSSADAGMLRHNRAQHMTGLWRQYQIDPTGLVAHLKQRDLRSGVATDTWDDLSGQNNDMYQGTAGNQPTVVSGRSGYRTFDGTADFMVQKEQDDETGATANYLSTVNGTAFAYCPGFDFTPYQDGNHLVVFHDSGGKAAMGYIKAEAPAGETLDSELCPDPGFDNAADWNVGAGWAVAGGLATATAAPQNINSAVAIVDAVAGVLFKEVVVVSDYTSGEYIVGYTGSGGIYSSSQTSSGTKSLYLTSLATGTKKLFVGWSGTGAKPTIVVSDISFKKVTVPPATGALLVSTPGGATRNFASIDAGFNPNLVTSFEVYKSDFNIPTATDRTILMWAKPADGQPAAADVLIGKMDATNSRLGYGLSIDTAGKVKATMSNDGAVDDYFLTNAAVFSDGAQTAFKFIGAVYDASASNIDVFVNGSEVASTEGGDVSTTVFDSAAAFMLGKAADGSLYAGDIAEALVFSRALSAAESGQAYKSFGGNRGRNLP